MLSRIKSSSLILYADGVFQSWGLVQQTFSRPCPIILFKVLPKKYSYGLAPDEIGNIWQENRVSTGEAIWDLRALEKCIKIQDLLVFGSGGI